MKTNFCCCFPHRGANPVTFFILDDNFWYLSLNTKQSHPKTKFSEKYLKQIFTLTPTSWSEAISTNFRHNFWFPDQPMLKYYKDLWYNRRGLAHVWCKPSISTWHISIWQISILIGFNFSSVLSWRKILSSIESYLGNPVYCIFMQFERKVSIATEFSPLSGKQPCLLLCTINNNRAQCCEPTQIFGQYE